jgi:putative serine protease PepD
MKSTSTRRSIIANSKESICRIISSGKKAATGSGFFVATNGIALTCNHVISYFEPDANGYIKSNYSPKITIETSKGIYDAKIIHNMNSTHPLFEDYAVLKVDITDTSPLRLGDPNLVEPGDDVLILGFPFSLQDLCATSGIVSSKHRSPSLFNRMVLLDMLRIDGSVNVGNSGGPLIDLNSQSVVGIVSIRLGNLSKQIERLKERNDIPEALLELFEWSNVFLNVGIGEAISIRYALNELRQLEINVS